MREFCVTEEARENNIKTVTWNMRLVVWLKELKERREIAVNGHDECSGGICAIDYDALKEDTNEDAE